ncbi:MAG: amidohydrolase family protein [Gemmatimonadota bacterium]
MIVAGGASHLAAQPVPKTYELRGGEWWTGSEFEPRTMYSVEGLFSRERPARVDSLIDLAGLYIVPPYAEAHTHTIAYSRDRIGEFLDAGVFYALVMNVHRSTIGDNFTWFNRPRSIDIGFATEGVTASDGHPIQIGLRSSGSTLENVDGDWITIIESDEDLEEKWPALRDANPDLIKLFLLYSDRYAERHGDTTIAMRYKGMDPRFAAPIVERAHAAGLRVAAHVRTAADFAVAVEAGVDIVAHLPGFSMGPGSVADLENPERMADIEHPESFRIRPEDAALAGARRITVIPTIRRLGGAIPDSLPHATRMALQRVRDTRDEVVIHNLRLLREHGVPIAIGSDAGEGTSVPEVLVLKETGLYENAELVRLLTETSARLVFPRRSIGRLEDGYEASFLALDGDPIQRLEHLRDIVLRFKQGEQLEPGVGEDGS